MTQNCLKLTEPISRSMYARACASRGPLFCRRLACNKRGLFVTPSWPTAAVTEAGSKMAAISFRGRCHLVHPHHQFNSSRFVGRPARLNNVCAAGKGLAGWWARLSVTRLLGNKSTTEFHLHFKQAAAMRHTRTSLSSYRRPTQPIKGMRRWGYVFASGFRSLRLIYSIIIWAM